MEEKKSGADRRRFPRLDVEVDVRYRIISGLSEGKAKKVERKFEKRQTRDISPLGVCIETGRHLPVDSILEMRFGFPEKSCTGIGRVVWSRDIEDNGVYFTGVEFLAVDHGHIDQMANCIARYYFDEYSDKSEKHFSFFRKIVRRFLKD